MNEYLVIYENSQGKQFFDTETYDVRNEHRSCVYKAIQNQLHLLHLEDTSFKVHSVTKL